MIYAGLALLVLACSAPHHALAAKKWREYTGCRLIPHSGNDGDSFHVKPSNRKSRYLFRLYFVDTPESEKSLPERLQEQADYFGIADIKDIVKLGKEATKFTEQFLADGNFTVHSRLSDALGRSSKDRNYGMILSADGRDLGYELVRNGLARIHGMPTNLSDLDAYKRSSANWQKYLRGAEAQAKNEKLGGWAYASPTSRLDALFAPREVEEQDVVLSRTISIYPTDPSQTRPIGRLNPGVTVHVIKGISPDRAQVKFTTSNGKTYEGSARFIDLGL
ncbi:MAG: thermonuclease family protein [Kiritimatiellae bacterium]|nr:thermonuclease family protein [Kiritimatiellia bacterium]MDD4341486.1 thermonuclease family protein [Kiritimatiellia bacterium]